jgi:hypothetical protein
LLGVKVRRRLLPWLCPLLRFYLHHRPHQIKTGRCLHWGIRCNHDDVTAIEYLLPCAAQAPESLLAKEVVRQINAWFA